MAKPTKMMTVTVAAAAGSQRTTLVVMVPVSLCLISLCLISLCLAAGLAVSVTPARVSRTTTATITASGRSDGASRSR